jgi:hypothetical protein
VDFAFAMGWSSLVFAEDIADGLGRADVVRPKLAVAMMLSLLAASGEDARGESTGARSQAPSKTKIEAQALFIGMIPFARSVWPRRRTRLPAIDYS